MWKSPPHSCVAHAARTKKTLQNAQGEPPSNTEKARSKPSMKNKVKTFCAVQLTLKKSSVLLATLPKS
jgi:hypothetical protein